LPDQDHSCGLAINNAGVVVGQYWTVHPGFPPDRAFVNFPASSAEAGSYDLNSPDIVTNLGDWSLWSASGINTAGQIVGYGAHKNDPGKRMRGFLLTPQASPDPLALNRIEGLLAGLLMLFGGAEWGGSGVGIPFRGGRPIHIPPHEPLASIWQRLLPVWRRLS